MNTLIYDGSFDGFCTCVHMAYRDRRKDVSIVRQDRHQSSLFGSELMVESDIILAERVWTGLKNKISRSELKRIFYAFLSEEEKVEDSLLEAIRYIFGHAKNVASDFTNPHILKISKLAKSVSRERHRMTAFIRFKLTRDEIYFANIAPDFNVLSLVVEHFRNRYADQQWIIYDIKRNHGYFYNLKNVEPITLNFNDNFDPWATPKSVFSSSEIEFQALWKNYFKSTNIKERINTKLHLRHVPKRYWKYLSEKQP